MRVLLNCDQVFEVLTRGPFPAGGPDDDAVERHLSSCAECRLLAEALRPAVAIFHEALAPEQVRELPAYQGRLPQGESSSAAPPRLAGMRALGADDLAPRESGARDLDAVRLGPGKQTPASQAAFRRWAPLAAGLLLAFCGGAAVVGMAGGIRQLQSQPELFAAGSPVSLRPARLTAEGRRTLGALELKQVCFPPATIAEVVATTTDLVCCTQCHAEAAAGEMPPRVSVGRLQQSCLACHQG